MRRLYAVLAFVFVAAVAALAALTVHDAQAGRAYGDTRASIKDKVRVAVGTNVDVSSPGATLDGETMAADDDVLLYGQSTSSENGIWTYRTSTTRMFRRRDMLNGVLPGDLVPIYDGTYAGSLAVATAANTIAPVAPSASDVLTALAAATGAVDVNAQNITNVGTVDGIDVSALSTSVSAYNSLKATTKPFDVLDDDSAASNGTAVFAVEQGGGVVRLYSANAGTADAYLSTSGTGDAITIYYNADPATNLSGVALRMDEDGTGSGPRFEYVSTLAVVPSRYVATQTGRFLPITAVGSSSDPQVYFDDDGDPSDERLLFVSPTDTTPASIDTSSTLSQLD